MGLFRRKRPDHKATAQEPHRVEALAPPSIATELDADMVQKFQDRDYLAPADSRWIPCVQQVLRGLRLQAGALLSFSNTLTQINAKLDAIQKRLTPGPATRLSHYYSKGGIMANNLPDDQEIVVTLDVTDLEGRHGASLDAPPVWSVDDPTTGTVIPADDGLSAILRCTPGGQGTNFKWTAKSTSGGGAKQLEDEDVITPMAGAADKMGHSYSPPRPITG